MVRFVVRSFITRFEIQIDAFVYVVVNSVIIFATTGKTVGRPGSRGAWPRLRIGFFRGYKKRRGGEIQITISQKKGPSRHCIRIRIHNYLGV